MDKYSQIINLPYHKSQDRPRMSMTERAAQFAPFATLRGHEEAILEVQRMTDTWSEPTEEEAAHLSAQTMCLEEQTAAGERPVVTVTYFLPDEKKTGGSYRTHTGALRRIDPVGRVFLFSDGTQISMTYISCINPDRE